MRRGRPKGSRSVFKNLFNHDPARVVGRADLPVSACRFTDAEMRRLDRWLAMMDARARLAARRPLVSALPPLAPRMQKSKRYRITP